MAVSTCLCSASAFPAFLELRIGYVSYQCHIEEDTNCVKNFVVQQSFYQGFSIFSWCIVFMHNLLHDSCFFSTLMDTIGC
jgi:hypothetical protein